MAAKYLYCRHWLQNQIGLLSKLRKRCPVKRLTHTISVSKSSFLSSFWSTESKAELLPSQNQKQSRKVLKRQAQYPKKLKENESIQRKSQTWWTWLLRMRRTHRLSRWKWLLSMNSFGLRSRPSTINMLSTILVRVKIHQFLRIAMQKPSLIWWWVLQMKYILASRN